jgi:hypothetical protein
MLQNLYLPLLTIHSLLRWLVLASALAAIAVCVSGWAGRKPWSQTVRRFGVMFVASMDLQFLLGLVLYVWASPIVKAALQNMAAAMKQKELRFFAVEHVTSMLLALIFAHLGSILAKKAASDPGKYRRAAICWSLSLLCVLAGIPWWRPLFRFFS